MLFYKFDISQWVLGTNHLVPEDVGIYLKLVNYYYDKEGDCIPEDTRMVLRKLNLSAYKENVDDILEEFFYLDDGYWKHSKCDQILAEYTKKAAKNRVNGQKGGRPKGSGKAKSGQNNPEETQQKPTNNPDGFQNKANGSEKKPYLSNKLSNNTTTPNGVVCPEPPQEGSEPIFIEIPTNRYGTKDETYKVKWSMVEEFTLVYPAVDVQQEFRQMRSWSLNNKTKRKTLNGMPAFIDRWLSKEQNRGNNAQSRRPGQQSHQSKSDQFWDGIREDLSEQGET